MAGAHATEHSSTDAIRVGFLGLNAWAVLLLIPALHTDGMERPYLLSLPLVALALVSAAWLRGWAATPWLSFVVFPVAVGAAIAFEPRLRLGDSSPVPLIVAGVCTFATYLAVAAHSSLSRLKMRTSTEYPLASKPRGTRDGHRRFVRHGLLALGALMTVALLAVAPYVGQRHTFNEAWRDAASEGAMLTALVASAIATASLAVFIGPALRSDRRAARAGKGSRAKRVVPLLLLVVLGVVAIVLYRKHS